MEAWELDFEWLQLRHKVKERFKMAALPDLSGVLFLIGIQELGDMDRSFTKEEKQDLMHVGVCTLLEEEGYYKFNGRDDEGWPHWEQIKKFTVKGADAQEDILKKRILEYLNI